MIELDRIMKALTENEMLLVSGGDQSEGISVLGHHINTSIPAGNLASIGEGLVWVGVGVAAVVVAPEIGAAAAEAEMAPYQVKLVEKGIQLSGRALSYGGNVMAGTNGASALRKMVQ